MATTTRAKAAPAATPTEALAAVRLTSDMLTELRRPFAPAAIKYKPQTVTKDMSKAMGTFYVDARLVAERLNTVIGPEWWTDTYRLLFEDNAAAHGAAHFPVECSLTVCGVTKVDVGCYQKSKPDTLALKSAYSDALKRAAVKFGVGAYLYGLPKVWAAVDTYGEGQNRKVKGFSTAGVTQLRAAYNAWLTSDQPFGEALDHGDVGDDPDLMPEEAHEETPAAAAAPPAPAAPAPAPEAAQSAAAPAEPMATKDEVVALKHLAERAGFSSDDIVKVLKAEHGAYGGYRKSWILEQEKLCRDVAESKGADQGNA